MLVRVRALKLGFSGGVRRRLGDVFNVERDKIGSWMEPIDSPQSEKQSRQPATLSLKSKGA